jgi:hypothetical protein
LVLLLLLWRISCLLLGAVRSVLLELLLLGLLLVLLGLVLGLLLVALLLVLFRVCLQLLVVASCILLSCWRAGRWRLLLLPAGAAVHCRQGKADSVIHLQCTQ